MPYLILTRAGLDAFTAPAGATVYLHRTLADNQGIERLHAAGMRVELLDDAV